MTTRNFTMWTTVAALALASSIAKAEDIDIYQASGGGLPFLFRFMRMHTDRAPDVVMALGNRPHLVELIEPRADR